ncbi:hypothetical protein BDF20DRAFT_825912 [Mycotypha africana]|uniref:uncharacterized protein n=1 Tax=Mycotypha africana TaxID=64632 RepID=UPI002301FC09|nr:uncharacterized protein BDF20DRAFT_825912 [Mycotypha africana]KAI8969910.1 hypothetical protein BDF20DRAFT_825912 [Mycotypha africana]
MDLSWCIICDRHCTGDNLYCSETCRTQDIKQKKAYVSPFMFDQSPSTSLVSSPLLDPFLSSFNHERRASVTISRSIQYNNDIAIYPSPSSITSIQLI